MNELVIQNHVRKWFNLKIDCDLRKLEPPLREVVPIFFKRKIRDYTPIFFKRKINA